VKELYKVLFVEVDKKAANCEQTSVKQSQPAVRVDSNEYLIRFDLKKAEKYCIVSLQLSLVTIIGLIKSKKVTCTGGEKCTEMSSWTN
jgi:hypothetical protein